MLDSPMGTTATGLLGEKRTEKKSRERQTEKESGLTVVANRGKGGLKSILALLVGLGLVDIILKS